MAIVREPCNVDTHANIPALFKIVLYPYIKKTIQEQNQTRTISATKQTNNKQQAKEHASKQDGKENKEKRQDCTKQKKKL